MNKFIAGVTTFFLFLMLSACDTRVSSPSEKSNTTESLKSEDAVSNVELLENNSAKAAVTCSPQNSVKFIVTQNDKARLLCRETSHLDRALSAGPVCSGGVNLTSFEIKSSWVDCDNLTVCGQKAKTVNDLLSKGATHMRQMSFTGLPWGCQAEIEFATEGQKSTSQSIRKINLDVKAPVCPVCDVNNTRTCDICGVDKTSPEILDVFTESSQCNRIRVLVFAKDDNSGLNAEAYSFDAGVTWQADSFKDYTGLELSLVADKIRIRDRAGNIAKYSKTIASTSSPCPCTTPWGEKIEHGQTRAAYKSATVSCTTTCDANSQQRTCNNGVLSGSDTYGANSCQVTGCPKCKLPWGGEIDHGVKVSGFNRATAACAGECGTATLTCDKGNLIGGADVFRFAKCTSTRPSCDCKHAGLVIPNGQKRKVFASTEVNCGSSCDEGEVTCASGELQGKTSYMNVSCSPKICKCLTTWGQQIDVGQTVKAYKAATLKCEDKIVCDDPSNKIDIKCGDAIKNSFIPTPATAVVADFKQPSCAATVCGCVHLGTVFKPTDPPLKVYKLDKASSPNKCELAGVQGEVTCKLSGSTYTVVGDKDTNVFKYTQCQNITGNSSDYVVGAGDGGGANGGVGNDTGEGEGFRRHLKGGGGGSGCDINQPPYYCWGAGAGVQVPTGFCRLPVEAGYVPPGTDVTDVSQRISPGGYIPAYSRQQVGCNESCSKYMGFVSCDHGIMSDKIKFPYLNCKEVCP